LRLTVAGLRLDLKSVREPVGGRASLVQSSYICSGYLYAANVGWICLGNGAPADGIRYANTSAHDFGVNHDGLGRLEGYAWGANIGWLTFTNRDAGGLAYDGPRVDLFTGKLSGYAWSANAGWISLSNALAFVQTQTMPPGADADKDGIVDAWELLHFGNLTNADATSDFDGDGSSDRAESVAGTNPKDPASKLDIISYALDAGRLSSILVWQSQPNRRYRILSADLLTPNQVWTDLGLGWIDPDPGSSTRRSFSRTNAFAGFYRLETAKPLAP